MSKKVMDYKFVHISGIGGASTSAIAEYLVESGVKVTGSESNLESEKVRKLRNLGVEISYPKSENISTQDLLIYSQAVLGGEGRVEIDKAEKLGIKTLKNTGALWELIGKNKKTIAISGAHGKTTVTGMMGATLIEGDLDDSTVFSGGEIVNFGKSFHSGSGEFFIVEACEYRKNFLNFKSTKALIITNIEEDHKDFYTEGIEQVKDAFFEMGMQVKDDGFIVGHENDLNVSDVLSRLRHAGKRIVTYGECSAVDFLISGFSEQKSGIDFYLTDLRNPKTYKIESQLFGRQNAWNAAGVFATLKTLGFDPAKIQTGIKSFRGSVRRQEKIGEISGIPVFDDYAHHPTQIKVVIESFKRRFEKLAVIFEPHQYSRTRELWDNFTKSFSRADKLFLFPVFEVSGRDSVEDKTWVEEKDLGTEIQKNSKIKVEKLGNYERIPEVFEKIEKDNLDCVLVLGAGSLSGEVRKFFVN